MTSPLRSLLLILILAWTGAALADDVVMAFGEKIPLLFSGKRQRHRAGRDR